MNRQAEINRISTALKTRNAQELEWAERYARIRVDSAYKASNKKEGKKDQRLWREILEKIQAVILSLDATLYDKWEKSLLDHNKDNGDWLFDIKQSPANVPDALLCEFIIRLNSEWGRVSKNHTTWQIGKALNYIYDSACSNYSHAIFSNEETILSLKNLYRDCFNKICLPTLGHLSEEGNEVNYTCYMLWDIAPVQYCANKSPRKDSIYTACLDVMRYALTLNNISCIESGLHGLGHLVYTFPDASHAIENFIQSGRSADNRIMRYAGSARTGCIN